jgi:hypothetical protein
MPHAPVVKGQKNRPRVFPGRPDPESKILFGCRAGTENNFFAEEEVGRLAASWLVDLHVHGFYP